MPTIAYVSLLGGAATHFSKSLVIFLEHSDILTDSEKK